jgi:molybdopterin-guanine dinucleotide biosynthesis protein A
MGIPKASLPFGPENMLQRVVRLLGQVVEPVVVVAAPRQTLPDLPPSVRIAHDRQENKGPLEGIRAGLLEIQQHVDAAFVVSCDVPLLAPALVRHMAAKLQHHDVAVAVDGDLHHPLTAVYRVNVLSHIGELVSQDQLRPVFVYDRVPTKRIPIDELRDVDPQLQSFTNLNQPQDYLAALQQAGLTPDEQTLRRLGLRE